MLITKRKINSIKFFNALENKENIKIGVLATEEALIKMGIEKYENGLSTLPSAAFGINCKRNAYGYSKADTTKPKQYRYIMTREWSWEQWVSGGGTETQTKFVDIYRMAYPRIEIPADEVELVLQESREKSRYFVANLVIKDFEKQTRVIKQTINMFLEIFGYCQIFESGLDYGFDISKIKKCNWELLPRGVKIWIDEKNRTKQDNNEHKISYEQYRISTIQKMEPRETHVGKNGFKGYYAFVFCNICIFENSLYGNATYIVKNDNWERLSQMTKKELVSESKLIKRIIHNSKWTEIIVNEYNNFEK